MIFDYLIIAGGQFPSLSFARQLIKKSKNIVTVDRGAELALKLEISPILHVGDGDSFLNKKLAQLKAAAIVELPQRKSISDLEYALSLLNGLKSKLVIGAHSNIAKDRRPDHAFLNFLLLLRAQNLYFADEETWVTGLVPKKIFSFSASKNSIFSIAGTSSKNLKISILGSAYDTKLKMFKHTTQGLSNLTRSQWTRIKATSPALLFVSSNILRTKIVRG